MDRSHLKVQECSEVISTLSCLPLPLVIDELVVKNPSDLVAIEPAFGTVDLAGTSKAIHGMNLQARVVALDGMKLNSGTGGGFVSAVARHEEAVAEPRAFRSKNPLSVLELAGILALEEAVELLRRSWLWSFLCHQ